MSLINSIVTDEWCREICNYYDLLQKYNDSEIINLPIEKIKELETILLELYKLSITKISYRRIIVETNLPYEFCMTYRDLYKQFISLVKILNKIYKTNDNYKISKLLFSIPSINFIDAPHNQVIINTNFLKKIEKDFGMNTIKKIIEKEQIEYNKEFISNLFIDNGNL